MSDSGCYERLSFNSNVDGLFDDPRNPPEGCSRHYISDGTAQRCEQYCNEDSTCDAYTYFTVANPDASGIQSCVTCSEAIVGDNSVTNIYAESGRKLTCRDASR
jgi:hypothetical protein